VTETESSPASAGAQAWSAAEDHPPEEGSSTCSCLPMCVTSHSSGA